MGNECNGYLLSACCGATLKWGDICTNCFEHADNQCEDCPQEDKDQCEYITE